VTDLDWREPTSLDEALDLLAAYGDEAKVLAGGTWIALVLRQGLLAPSLLVSLQRIAGLNNIQEDADGSVHLGPMVRLRQAELSPLVRERLPLLVETLAEVANVRVRHQATIGGNLCDADYASDPPSVLAALGARVELSSQRGQRIVPVRDLIVGHYATVVEPDELLVDVVIPPLSPGTGASYLKFRTRSHEDRPCLGVAAVVSRDSDQRCREVEVVVGAVADRPQRFPDVLAGLVGQPFDAVAIEGVAEAYATRIDPISDLRGSSEYRRKMIRVFVRRALRAAIAPVPSLAGEG
jgi:carbon-monoxide dehydrogenase medium subunit